jgi:hypothetical protein
LSEDLNDFGFTSEEEFKALPPDNRLKRVEDLIMPLLKRLSESSGDIKWPDRKTQLEELIRKILEITRS